MENELVSTDEKIHMVRQFMKNLSYSRYNIELSLLSENAVSIPNQNNVDSFTLQLQEIDDKLLVLEQELTSLEGE
jgi:hypothetical protein